MGLGRGTEISPQEQGAWMVLSGCMNPPRGPPFLPRNQGACRGRRSSHICTRRCRMETWGLGSLSHGRSFLPAIHPSLTFLRVWGQGDLAVNFGSTPHELHLVSPESSLSFSAWLRELLGILRGAWPWQGTWGVCNSSAYPELHGAAARGSGPAPASSGPDVLFRVGQGELLCVGVLA